jgi:7-cyano-7-deazaguanine synthase in queuosine biosynthesis
MSDEEGLPAIRINVVEEGKRGRSGWIQCEIGTNLRFSADTLASYFFAEWKPVIFDALLLAAAVEYCDKAQRRPASGWGRDITLNLPVHDPEHWRSKAVHDSLHDALEFLTGDRWQIAFSKRRKDAASPQQGLFNLPSNAIGVVPFSDGLDSRAVGALLSKQYGEKIVCVRLGTKNADRPKDAQGRNQPFTAVPYKVCHADRQFAESSARSRGFKFAVLSGLAAHLAGAGKVFLPESGQGALGPGLVTVGQAYEDFRNHPRFTRKMSVFLKALLGHEITFEFPRLWFTKGETLAAYAASNGASSEWADTRSCWQDNRHVSVDGHRRQCGICAACMLRRMSLHAAGLDEPQDNYVWEDLTAPDFKEGAARGFDKITRAQRQYAIAGALHLDHLASVRRAPHFAQSLDFHAFQISEALRLPEEEVRSKIDRLLSQHEKEWTEFMDSLGPKSFIAGWIGRAQ